MESRLGAALAAQNSEPVGGVPSPRENVTHPAEPRSPDTGKPPPADVPEPPEDIVNAAPPPGDEPPPSEAFEAAMLTELRARGEPAFTPPPAEGEAPKGKLPPLEELVGRIPAETRQLLDELFRARFTEVRRVPAKALKG